MMNREYLLEDFRDDHPQGATPLRRSILIGTMLGDSHVKKGRGSVKVEQKERDYAQWLFDQLNPFCTHGGVKRTSRLHRQTGVESFAYRFYTRSHFRSLRTIFYDDHATPPRKRVPREIEPYFDEVALAVFIMDDGYKASQTDGALALTLDGYDRLSEGPLLQAMLWNRFQLEPSVQMNGRSRSGRSQWKLYFGADQYDRLHRLISPTISQVPVMATKKLSIVRQAP
uniref:Putative LAGLIDADG homing endonuclease n=1 Tax=Botryococcus braunii TaxID=38881 RepID=A0A097KQC1_BOTBR|nr:putative LAGLIDADG homing endonuclease [Botryococcus braunii]AIT95383.1 putative LAGLIDADG homing endonuclease [Botryococcus braunii]